MGVVNQDGIVFPRGGRHLHPALYVGYPGQDGGALLQGNPQGQGRPQHAQGIVNHETPGNIHPDGDPVPAVDGGKGHMVLRQKNVLRPEVRSAAAGKGNHFTGRALQEPGRPGVPGVDHSSSAVPEQDGLGVTVFLHGLVEVQVVLGQIRENAHRIGNAVDPVQVQGMGGDLHHHMGAARVPHRGKELLEFKGLGSGPLCRQGLLPNHILVCANQAHLFSLGLQNRLEEIG